ncbi:GrpB family protein [Fusibacter sp. JL298sf-3]
MKVKLKKHNPNWRKMYEDEALALRSIFKMDLIDIQHVGSTSIRSVDAKPIIDIVIGLETFSTGEKYIDILIDYG